MIDSISFKHIKFIREISTVKIFLFFSFFLYVLMLFAVMEKKFMNLESHYLHIDFGCSIRPQCKKSY